MRTFIAASILTLLAANAQALDVTDLLSTIAMPLAVAAVADITGVPQDQLANFVTALNTANVPPAQVIEVVRYVPVVLVDDGPTFVQFVQDQTTQGVTGSALVPVIIQRLQPYYPSTQITVTAPPLSPNPAPIVVDERYIPPIVVTRVAEVRKHPHGGPPGQLKKQQGLQTGAEVVHGKKPGHQFTPAPVVVATPVVVQHEKKAKDHGKGHERTVVVAPAPVGVPQPVVVVQTDSKGKGHGPAGGGPPGQAKQHGKGKGKG
jgi:hypothetical protein